MNSKDFIYYANLSAEEILRELKSSILGLTDLERSERYLRFGPNERQELQHQAYFSLIKNQLFNPFIALLFAIAFTYGIVGHYSGACIVLMISIINVATGFYQEYQNNKIKIVLKHYFSEKVVVRRANKDITIPQEQIVIGDILFLKAGDVIVADCRLLESDYLLVDESRLIEKQTSVKKITKAERKITELSEAQTCCFAGTTVISGEAVAIVFATGDNTILASVEQHHDYAATKSVLVKGTMHLAYMVLFFVLISLVIVFIINFFIERELVSWLDFMLFSIALGMSAIPSSLPITVSFCLTKAAEFLYSKKIILRRLSVVEELAGLEVLCINFSQLVDENEKSLHVAIEKAQSLGLSVKIMSDNDVIVANNRSIQLQWFADQDKYITGAEFERISEKEKMMIVHDKNVFTELTADQKYHIISCLQRKYSVGYVAHHENDMAALAIANVGIVPFDASKMMRECAKIITLDHGLIHVVESVKECRKVLTNAFKYVKITLSSNLGNFYSLAFSSLLINYLPMLPLQLLFLDFMGDIPLFVLPVDLASEEELKNPLRFSAKDVFITILFGLISSPFAFLIFILFKHHPGTLQTNWFISSVLIKLVLIFSLRVKTMFWQSSRPSLSFMCLCIIIGVGVVLLPFTALGHHIFLFVPPAMIDLSKILCIVFSYFVTVEAIKLFYNRSAMQ